MQMKSRTRKLVLNLATSVAIIMTALVVLTPAVTFANPSASAGDETGAAGTASAGALPCAIPGAERSVRLLSCGHRSNR